MESVSKVTEFLVNLLIGSLSAGTLAWVAVEVQTFISDRKREKREAECNKLDEEYQLKRMQERRK